MTNKAKQTNKVKGDAVPVRMTIKVPAAEFGRLMDEARAECNIPARVAVRYMLAGMAKGGAK
jgi:hypothetical protein